jgi:integrase
MVGYVLPSAKGNPIGYTAARRSLLRACERAKIADLETFAFHGFRA